MTPMPENQNPFINVLLVEANKKDARLLCETLIKPDPDQYKVTHVGDLGGALNVLGEESFDLILLDLSLPDSWGLNTVVQMHDKAPEVPIIVLTETDDESLAIKAVQEGTQDYLVKGQVSSNLLERSMRYAIERHRMLAQLRAMSLTDELTGLYNRRGFLTLAEQQLKMANRTKTEKFLLYADLDGLKQVNDKFGHQEGDMALAGVAKILTETFRESDIIARMGGDEFTVLLTTGVDVEWLPSRLQQNIEAYNKRANRPHKLSLSMGLVRYDPVNPCNIDELLASADKLMYEQKRDKQKKRDQKPKTQ